MRRKEEEGGTGRFGQPEKGMETEESATATQIVRAAK